MTFTEELYTNRHMLWTFIPIFLTAAAVIFFTRYIFFVIKIYHRLWSTLFFAVAFFLFCSIAALVFPYNEHSSTSIFNFYLDRHLIFLTLPLIVSAMSTYLFSFLTFQAQSIHYTWSGDTLTLFDGQKQITLNPQDIISVSYTKNPGAGHRMRPLNLYRINTIKGVFSFDELLEKSYRHMAKSVSFWSPQEGLQQANRNFSFPYSEARASVYFKKNWNKKGSKTN